MIKSIIKKDFIRNKAINVTLMLFLTLSAFLMGAGTMIIIQLMGSIDGLFEVAKPPHFLQMHRGEINQIAIDDFSQSTSYVTDQETVEMLNIDGASIGYLPKGKDLSQKITMSDNMMDNGFVTQNETFDFLLDLDNGIVKPNVGEIAVPISYMQQYDLKVGDQVIISEGDFYKAFIISDFVRDAQMASTMASSVRFLVNEEDHKLLSNNVGELEYIIEFRLADSELCNEFQTLYTSQEANMPTNGQAITYPLIKLVDAIADGMVAVIIILVSLLLIFIAMLNLKFTILATLEEEIKEIGTMKAIGIPLKEIKQLYLVKYRVLAVAGCVIGYILSIFGSNWFTQNMAVTFGRQELTIGSFLIPIFSICIVYLLVLFFCKRVLKRLEAITVVEALVLGTDEKAKKKRLFKYKSKAKTMSLEKSSNKSMNVFLGIRELCVRFKTWFLLFFIFMIATFIMVVPMNLLSTFEAPEFITSMGSAMSDIRVDIQSQDQIDEVCKDVVSAFHSDSNIESCEVYGTYKFEVYGEEGWDAFRAECGDYSKVQVTYLEGSSPIQEGEIALSYLNAQQLIKEVGDELVLRVNGEEVPYKVCGIYQDITSGGYTAKMAYYDAHSDALGYTIYVNTIEDVDIEKIANDYNEAFINAKIVPTQIYMGQTFSSVIDGLDRAVSVAMLMAILVTGLITVLFLKLQAAKSYSQIAAMKAIGFSTLDIRKQYLTKSGISVCIGIICGLILANTLGESVIGGIIAMAQIGMSHIDFIINPIKAYIICPCILVMVALGATWICSNAIKKYDIVALLSE